MTLLGAPVDRVDGPLKVTGAAPYPVDAAYPDMAYAALVRSTIAAGRILEIDVDAARAVDGVQAVITHLDAPRLGRAPAGALGLPPPAPLQDDRILHYGQYVAVVVADTPQKANEAARLVTVTYDPQEALLDLDDERGELVPNPFGYDAVRGDVDAGLAAADVVHDAVYTTAENTNNPLGLFATVAAWDGDTVVVHDASQWTSYARTTIASAFGLPEEAVRVHAPYLGGGFGAGLRAWQHVILAVLAARVIDRPVKVVLTRPQMFTGLGHRPDTRQRIRLGATREGDLLAIDHEAYQTVAMEDDNLEFVSLVTTDSYACPNIRARDFQRRLNIPNPGSMRAPGEAQGGFALESAIDELAYELAMDPLDLRLRNYAETHPQLDLPWSSKALRECYAVGAERFGWSDRNPAVGSMIDGPWQVGYGLAGVTYLWWQVRCQARVTIAADGTAYVRSAANDPGTGTYTVMQQLSAELLGLPLDQVRVGLGDSDMPWAPAAGGSGLTGALGNAIAVAVRALHEQLLGLAARDEASPLRGCGHDDIVAVDGRLIRRTGRIRSRSGRERPEGDPGAGESYVEILARNGLEELTADGESTPPDPTELGMAPSGAFAAKFVEVRVDRDLGRIRIARIVAVIDGGRILNEKLARSQVIGGTVGGIGQAIFEETITDAGTGRIANPTFGDYLVPVNADVPDINVVFVGEPDRMTPTGTKGVGEVGLAGTAAAIANAVYHATGRRIRSLPITIDQLL
jgi:CO/xanthine dehydrogenase Mo-binding subunit